ncbi:hypothetical protein ACXR2T_01600 [Leucobacter sp. HY1910]
MATVEKNDDARQRQQRGESVLADPTVPFRRRAAAVALPLAFACQLVCNSIYAWVSTTSGMSDTGGAAEMLDLYATFPTELMVATLFALIGSLLAVLGLPAALRVLRPAKPRLALWAVGLMVIGYICYFGIVFGNFDLSGIAISRVDAADALDTSPGQVWGMAFFLLFVIGNLGGNLLLGLTVILGGRRVGVPWWAGLLVLGWTIGHIVNIAGGGEWFAVVGGVFQIAGFVILAAATLRLADTEWVARG